MPRSWITLLATGLYGAGLSIEKVPPKPSMKFLSTWNSLRFACPPKSSWFSRMSTRAVLTRFRGRTAGMHLQDFQPPVEDHLPPGLGEFDFGRLSPFVTDDMVLAWEIHPHWKAEEIVDGLKPVHELLRKSVTA